MRQHYTSLEKVSVKDAWVTIGSFDGVHIGHQAIIRQLVDGAHHSGLPAVVLTFYPHPVVILRGRTGDFYLNTPDEREALLYELGVDKVVTLEFNAQMAATSARDFVLSLKEHLGMKRLCVGRDFALGHGREGTVEVLRQMGQELDFTVDVVEAVMEGNQPVSSSRIRALLEAGDVLDAASLLGRPYRLTGKVIPGDQRGRVIGIPTANLDIPQGKLKPTSGVYACRAYVGDQAHAAAVNIGVRPTFDGQGTAVHVEAHLLDFDGDLYGKQVSLDFLEWLRGEVRFPSVQDLVDQIRIDIEETRKINRSRF